MNKRKVVWALGITVAVGAASGTVAASGDLGAEVARHVRAAWGQLEEVSALDHEPGLIVGAEGVLVFNAADVAVIAALPVDDQEENPFIGLGSGLLTWGNNQGLIADDEVGIKGLLGVSAENAGFVMVTNGNNTLGWRLDGNTGLQSQAGDLAEAFPTEGGSVEPGSVVVIDSANPGALRIATEAYDRRVAGVVAGANGYPPGITLRGLAEMRGKVAVTLTGTVYCMASDFNGPIRTGDFLTTSPIPGHAMKATDPDSSRGAILGKAMQDLTQRRGKILVLASLQ